MEKAQMGKLLDNLRNKHATASRKTGRHTINFLAHKDEIAEAMREGWTAKQIWEQMVEDNMTTMSYSTFCRQVDKHIMPAVDCVNSTVPSANASRLPSSAPKKSPANTPAKKVKPSKRELTEKERLDLLKEEAFASVRSSKPSGALIGKPKTREEENEELFG